MNKEDTTPKHRTPFDDWCDNQGVEPTEALRAAFHAGMKHTRDTLGNPAPYMLKIAPFTQTVVQVYGERDQARAEVKELARHLAKANEINAKFNSLLKASRELIEVYG